MTIKSLLVILLLIGCIVIARVGCGSLCEDEVQGDVASEDGTHHARIVIRGCGATTDFVTVVQLGANGRYRDIFSVEGQADLRLGWRASGQRLVISVPSGLPGRRVSSSTSEIDGITVAVE